MATIKHYKVVAALPSTLVADSIYLVRVGTGFDLYVTNSSGTIVAYPANYQAGSANLNALSGLIGAANKAPYFTAAGAMAVYDLTVFGRSLNAAADAAAARTAMELGTAATRNTGTSGANVPLLSTGNTWSATQVVNSGGSGYVAFQLVRADQGAVGETDTAVIDIQTGTGATRLLQVSGATQRWIAIPRGAAAPQYNDGAALRTMWHSGNFEPATKQDLIAAGSTAQFWRGDKTWQDLAAAVRAVVLTGLSTASAAVVAATDTVLAAIGKLQAQINGLSAASYTNLTLQSPYTWDAAGDAADYNQPSYAKVGDVVRLRGKVTLSGTHTSNATVNVTTIATLPVGFRPLKRKVFQVFWDTNSPLFFAYCLVFVNTNGTILMVAPASNQPYPFTEGHLLLDQIWFDLAP